MIQVFKEHFVSRNYLNHQKKHLPFQVGRENSKTCWQADGRKLREKTVEYIKKFEKKSWSEIPIVSYLHGELLEKEQHEIVPTIDSFNRENGKQVLASKAGVDKVIHFMQNAKDFHKGVNKDFLQAGREIDAILCDHERLAPIIIGNQCLDFQKQDGITEIEESIQVVWYALLFFNLFITS